MNLFKYSAAKSKDEHADVRPLFAVCDAARSEVEEFSCFELYPRMSFFICLCSSNCRKLISDFGFNPSSLENSFHFQVISFTQVV